MPDQNPRPPSRSQPRTSSERPDSSSGGDQTASTSAVYVISVAAELAGVHAQTLRIYERKGLLEPARTDGGSRRYSDRDIATLTRIVELTTEGLNLAGVKRVLELEARVASLKTRLAKAQQIAQQASDQARRQPAPGFVPLPPSGLRPTQRRN